MLEERDKSTADVTQDQSLPVTERKQEDSSRNSSRGQTDQNDVAISCSNQARRPMQASYSMLNNPTNSNLTTPMCWSKHAALLGGLVGTDTTNQVVRWTADQVVDFLAKFGVNKLMLEKFKHEVR